MHQDCASRATSLSVLGQGKEGGTVCTFHVASPHESIILGMHNVMVAGHCHGGAKAMAAKDGNPGGRLKSEASPSRPTSLAERKAADASPQQAPHSSTRGSSYRLCSSYVGGTRMAGVAPRPAWLTVALSTQASRTMATVSPWESPVLGASLSDCRTISTAKKTPAMGALNPAATPAARHYEAKKHC